LAGVDQFEKARALAFEFVAQASGSRGGCDLDAGDLAAAGVIGVISPKVAWKQHGQLLRPARRIPCSLRPTAR